MRFTAFVAGRVELMHVRTRENAPHTNGVRERGFGSLKYEHLYRHEITDGQALAAEAEYFREIFTWIRPHEALAMARPMEPYLPLSPAAKSTCSRNHPTAKSPNPCQVCDAGQLSGTGTRRIACASVCSCVCCRGWGSSPTT